MSLRAKMKRRVRWCLIGTVALAGLSAGAYVVRDRHLAARAITDRDEGLRLLEAGDHFKAMHKIGPYVRLHPDDVDTLFAYARARLGAPEPDGKHLVDGISLMRRVRGLDPGHAAVTNELLELYGQVGWVTELQVLADELLAGDPAHPAALRARATALARARKFEDALKASSKYNELHPQDLDGQILTLTILSQCDRSRERLLAYAEKLNASKPDDLRLLVVRSLACQFAGDVGRAAELAKEAAASDMPDAATALLLSRQCNLLEL